MDTLISGYRRANITVLWVLLIFGECEEFHKASQSYSITYPSLDFLYDTDTRQEQIVRAVGSTRGG